MYDPADDSDDIDRSPDDEMYWDHSAYDELEDEDDEFDPDADLVVCSECGSDYYDDAPICPHCGAAPSVNTSIWAGRPLWWVALGVLGVLTTLYLLLFP